VPASVFKTIVEKSPVLHRQIVNQYLVELENAEKKTVNLAHKTVREKVADAILTFAKFYEYEKNHKSFKIHFCRQDIADLTGTTKEQVSKTLNDFEKEKIIKCTAKRFTWLNVNELYRISNLNTSIQHEV
jgi:CRP/FNR family transcriptional regulator